MSYLYQGLAGGKFTTRCSPRTYEEREAAIRRNVEWETNGGDWDSDTETNDSKFDDLVHFELAER